MARWGAATSQRLIFLSNGEEVWFCDTDQDAHFRKVETVFSQDDLARRKAVREVRRSPLDIPIDTRIAGDGSHLFQASCIEVVCREIVNGRRKMLVEMATGTGKTRTAAALLKRLFEANAVTRALFVVDKPYADQVKPFGFLYALHTGRKTGRRFGWRTAFPAFLHCSE